MLIMNKKKRQQQLDKVIENVYDDFISNPNTYYIHRGTISNIERGLGVDKKEAKNIWELFRQQYVRERPTKNGNLFSVDAIKRVDKIRDDVPIDEEFQSNLIDYLGEKYLNSPNNSTVKRDKILSEFNKSEKKVDLNVYILAQEGLIDRNFYINSDKYESVELTELAKKQVLD